MGGRFTLWSASDAQPPSCLSCDAATSCGPIARSSVARERLGPWRERPPSPRARYGFGTRWKFTPRPCPPGVAPAPTIPGGKAVRTPLVGRGGATRSSSGCRRCRNCPRRSPASVRPRGRWLRPPTAALAPTPRSAFCPYAAAPVRVSPPVRGDRRFEAAVRLAASRDASAASVLRPSAKDCWTRSDPPWRLGMECTSQPPQMPQRASKKAGRYDHVLRFRRGTAAPEAVAQPQAGQGHARSPSCTSERRFRAHRPRFHMCGSIRARLRRFGTSSSLPRRSQASSRKERLNHRSRLEDRLLLQR